MDDISTHLQQIRDNASAIRVKFFNNKYIKFSNMDDPIHSGVSILPGATLINDDPKLMAEYANWQQTALVVLNNYIRTMNTAKRKATNLISFIRKEYHF